MKSLFPEMEREIAQDRLAERREAKQRACEFLRRNPGFEKFVMSHLEKHGPDLDINMWIALSDNCDVPMPEAAKIVIAVWALWKTGKLWTRKFPNHPCGATCYLYGIRGVHVNEEAK